MLTNEDYKTIECPKCHKKHFMKTGHSSEGSFFDVLKGFGYNDAVFRIPPKEVYINGELQNPEAHLPAPEKTHFECLECGCHFSVEQKYLLGGLVEKTIYDEDKLNEEREAAWKKRIEEQERKKKEAEEATATAPKYDPTKEGLVTIGDSLSVIKASDTTGRLEFMPVSQISDNLGNRTASEIDLGGLIIHSDKTFTDDQIKNMKDTFGWDVKNK